ncbi:hypothetical protein L6452_39022 [Arctium lappa]|uniref:Uncharacterized protein n=1 Tax=Arctium lappa TaxID=4217 RepID=A0ACB8XS23_ARCLA|nr:hypothetical protein L6452_39022 [Arctium lappa]
MAEKFLRKYFPPTRNAKSRNEICMFKQLDDEAIPDAWERFKELLRKFPHHGIPYYIQLETFYNGLNPMAKQMLDATSGGAFTANTYNDGYEILEKISTNNGHWADPRAQPQKKTAGVHDVDAYTAMTAQLTSMATMLKNLTSVQGVQSTTSTPIPTVLSVQCVCCGGKHSYKHCSQNTESVNYVHNKPGPYSNNYNASWRQHPNFSWNSPYLNPPTPKQKEVSNFQPQQVQHPSPPQNHHQQTFHQPSTQSSFQDKPNQQVESSTSLETILKGFINQTNSTMNHQNTTIRSLETQISQLALELRNRPVGTLPSDTEIPRPAMKEHVKAVTLRSGKRLIESEQLKKPIESHKPTVITPTWKDKGKPVDIGSLSKKTDFPLLFPYDGKKKVSFQDETSTSSTKTDNLVTSPVTPILKSSNPDITLTPSEQSPEKAIVAPVPSYIPFPQRLRNQKEELQFKKFLDVKKKKLNEDETVALTEGCSALLSNKIPPKLKDPGSFTITCSIGGKEIGKALCDLGASINLMPLSVFNTLGVGEARPTTITLQLADKSIAHPKGKIEDVLVQVEKFIFPADFIILDFEADKDIPIILGRRFLATGRTLIDVQKGELTMRLNEQNVTFNVFNSMKYPDDKEECFTLSDIESLCHKEEIEKMLDLRETEVDEKIEWEEEGETTMLQHTTAFELLENEDRKTHIPSVESPPDLELKPLPSHLKYAFLGEEGKLSVIISSTLEKHQEEQLLSLLKLHTKVIGWTISDLKGISPSICQHKIILADKNFTSIEPQRRLNPIMKEVVKKEILKWLDARIIYPIARSSWVSPIQCVPKKGGVTVIKNEKDELIPTRVASGWRICIDYRRLNKATQKDHFPLPFIDQMLDRLAGKEYYCFLDGYSGYKQIAITPEDQEKTTFTCPYGTFAFRRMPFGLCNAPATFQRCMMSIFSDMLETSM